MAQITIPFIQGDGIGKDISKNMIQVVNSAVSKTQKEIYLDWLELEAGEEAFKKTGSYLPKETLNKIEQHNLAIKGPLSTPVGGGIRSLNVFLRKKFDLFACVRPIKYFEGIPSTMKNPSSVNLTVFRENTEDIYTGIEFPFDSEETVKMKDFLTKDLKVDSIRFPSSSTYGVKVVSKQGSSRLIRSAFEYAKKNNLPKVTIVHKGNIMKYTEGWFRSLGLEIAKEYPEIEVDDYICDNFLQQIILNPSKFSVVATLNLNGDYISDAAAALVGGIGISPGANINYDTSCAIFEATHGTAPDIAGQNLGNPVSLILSACMMLEHLGLDSSANVIEEAIASLYKRGIYTKDLCSDKFVSTSEFCQELISCI